MIYVQLSGRTNILSSRLSRALTVIQTNPALHTMCASPLLYFLFLSYLPRPVPSDVQLFIFIQAVHIMAFVDCRADLVGQLSTDRHEELLQTDAAPVEHIWLRH